MAICLNCNKEIEENASVCPHCGSATEQNTSEEANDLPETQEGTKKRKLFGKEIDTDKIKKGVKTGLKIGAALAATAAVASAVNGLTKGSSERAVRYTCKVSCPRFGRTPRCRLDPSTCGNGTTY